MKLNLKRVSKKIKIYMALPHVWILFIVVLLALIMFGLSFVYRETNSFLSSIFANIFAGLLTGVIICLITTIKSISLYRTECKIKWLEDLHKACFNFNSMYNDMLLSGKNKFKSDEDFYEYVYNTLCCGNEVSHIISQSCFKEVLPFDPNKYCKKEFSFDAEETLNDNYILRDKIMEQDISRESITKIIEMFKPMEQQISTLNSKILKKINELKIKQRAITVSIG